MELLNADNITHVSDVELMGFMYEYLGNPQRYNINYLALLTGEYARRINVKIDPS